MDRYSFEHWMTERHQHVVLAAEARTRRQGWQPQDRLADHVAVQLRLLADRLDGRVDRPTVVSGSL